MEIDERKKEFLIGLEKLTRQTGIEIGGCGCCGSPYLAEADITDERSGYGYDDLGKVTWIDSSDEYDWKHFSNAIVKKDKNEKEI